jgi:hypothetical protein
MNRIFEFDGAYLCIKRLLRIRWPRRSTRPSLALIMLSLLASEQNQPSSMETSSRNTCTDIYKYDSKRRAGGCGKRALHYSRTRLNQLFSQVSLEIGIMIRAALDLSCFNSAHNWLLLPLDTYPLSRLLKRYCAHVLRSDACRMHVSFFSPTRQTKYSYLPSKSCRIKWNTVVHDLNTIVADTLEISTIFHIQPLLPLLQRQE